MLEDHPRILTLAAYPKGQIALAILTLSAIILFNAFFYIFRPYDGMAVYQEAPLGGVHAVYPGGPADMAGVEAGDLILAIDGKPVDPLRSEPRYRPGVKPGETVYYDIMRGDARIALSITIGSYLDNPPLLGLYLGVQFLSFGLWAIGLLLVLFAPQDDVRARLLGLGFLLAGLAAAVGGASGWNGFWGANTIQKALLSLLAPVIVAAHLTFPALSLPKYRGRIVYLTFGLAVVLATLVMIDDWALKPGGNSLLDLYGVSLRRVVFVFFMAAWLAAVALLVHQRFRSPDPEVRRQTGIIIWGMLLGIGPFFGFTLLPYILFGNEILPGAYTILFLILLPLAYAYVIFQRKLLKVDFIINRLLVWFILILLILAASIVILGALAAVFHLPVRLSAIVGLIAALLALSFTTLSKVVQVQVDRILYGGHYDYSTVTSSLSNRLAQTLDRATLVELLTGQLPRQMGVRQARLLLADGNGSLTGEVDSDRAADPPGRELYLELLRQGSPVRAAQLWGLLPLAAKANWAEFDWGQVYAPLIFKGELQGILILGQRTSGDVYSDQDLRIIASVAEQGALAVTNVLLVEELRGLAQQLVRSSEEERKRLASDLHDTLLQELFFIKQGLYKDPTNPALVGYLDESIQNLRRAIKAQRPPLLDRGLSLALQGLVEDMQKVAGSSVSISWSSDLGGTLGLTDEQAISFYRVAQEALSNAVKHGNARHIEVRLEGDADRAIRLLVSDDGVGAPWPREDGRQDQSHFGLVLMQERALMIDARLRIQATPGEGTTVELELGL